MKILCYRGCETGLPCGVLEIGQRAGILGTFGRSRQMKMTPAAKFFPRLDQALMDRIELVGMRGDEAALDRLLQPGPLKHRCLEDRGGRVRVICQKLRRTSPVETQVKPAIEASLIAIPAVGNQ